jgi:phosphoglycerate-specific signal transduction histidine kinase
MSDRLAKLEGSYDALKVVRPMTITVLDILLAALIFVLSFMAAELRDMNSWQQAIEAKFDATNAKIDSIPEKLAEEFRAMRAEMATQTNAIANSITAARQFQPQVLLMPVPQTVPPNGEAPANLPRPAPQPPTKR